GMLNAGIRFTECPVLARTSISFVFHGSTNADRISEPARELLESIRSNRLLTNLLWDLPKSKVEEVLKPLAEWTQEILRDPDAPNHLDLQHFASSPEALGDY